jgi:hypothetical protein
MLNSFREGNRSELLADYILSAIGISTPIRRQDDFGFDFYCHLSNDDDDKYLTFGFPFIIQIKSSSTTSILYGDKNPEKWRAEKISWLFRNEIPFFIGIVDKKNICIKIYDTTGLWQLYKNGEARNCSQIELIPKYHPYGERRENRNVEKLENWSEKKGDGYKYIIDLGNPIIDIKYSDLQKEEKDALIIKKKYFKTFYN